MPTKYKIVTISSILRFRCNKCHTSLVPMKTYISHSHLEGWRGAGTLTKSLPNTLSTSSSCRLEINSIKELSLLFKFFTNFLNNRQLPSFMQTSTTDLGVKII